jgi:hypothetical protein
LLAFSATFTFLASCAHLGLLRNQQPATYAALARVANTPVSWWERWRGMHHGPLELTVRLPPFTAPRLEPLLATGFAPEGDYIWIQYLDAWHVRVGVEHTNYGGLSTEPIEVDYSQPQRIVLAYGSLQPPPEHPFYDGLTSDETAALQRAVRVVWNGRTVLEDNLKPYAATPQTRWIGRSPYMAGFGERFTGEILAQRILEWRGIVRPWPAGRELVLTLTLPPGRPAGTADPLVQTGVTGAADTVYLRQTAEREFRIGLDHWGVGGPLGEPVNYEPGQPVVLRIKFGPFYPASHPDHRRLEVRVDGRTVLSDERDFYPSSVAEAAIGSNLAGSSAAAARFGGPLHIEWAEP